MLVLTALAVLTKLLGGFIGAYLLGRAGAFLVGLGMSPRGEVGIVVAALGLTLADADGQPLISSEIYAVLLAAVILTTLLAPLMLQWTIRRTDADGPQGPRIADDPSGA